MTTRRRRGACVEGESSSEKKRDVGYSRLFSLTVRGFCGLALEGIVDDGLETACRLLELLLCVVLLWIGRGGHGLCLLKGGTKGGVFDAELVDEGATLFPATVCLVCRGEGGVEELGAGLEGLDVPNWR